ncbi:MAG: hypothetical protein HZA90_00915 [Verrucomicrobia bacterium]|nr:hypothetical protein [Verrucomicrobiota bacterium]
MSADFPYDVFLSHSAKDKAVVRASSLSASDGERAGVRCRSLLRQDGLNPKVEGRRQKAENLHSPFCIHPSLCAFGSDRAQLEAGKFQFRDPLNRERRFISELQPSAFILQPFSDAPIKGSLAQFLYINWRPAVRAKGYATQMGCHKGHEHHADFN